MHIRLHDTSACERALGVDSFACSTMCQRSFDVVKADASRSPAGWQRPGRRVLTFGHTINYRPQFILLDRPIAPPWALGKQFLRDELGNLRQPFLLLTKLTKWRWQATEYGDGGNGCIATNGSASEEAAEALAGAVAGTEGLNPSPRAQHQS